MNLKLFYSPPKWMAFIAPEPPEQKEFEDMPNTHKLALEFYRKAYAEAKANALEVGNYGEIYTIVNDNLDREITLPCTEIDGVEYFDWKGSAVIKDGKYILTI